jgi:tetratricopeptide (TPR) repeat protein
VQALKELISVLKLQDKLLESLTAHEELLRHLQKCNGIHGSHTLKYQVPALLPAGFTRAFTLANQVKLAIMLQRCGRASDAEMLLRQALPVLQRSHADHTATLDCLSSLAFLLSQQGRLQEADPLLSEALEGSRRVFGPNNIKTFLVQNNFAALLMNRAAVAEASSDDSASALYGDAERIMRDALSRQLASIGESNPVTLQTMHNLAALLYARSSNSVEALELMRRTLRCRSSTLGVSHANTVAAHSALITMLLRGGEACVSEAEELMRSLIAVHQSNSSEWFKVQLSDC